MTRKTRTGAAAIAALLLASLTPVLEAQQPAMPAADQMSGVPLPSPELPTGTVTVRVARGTLADAIEDHPVSLTVAGETLEALTDAAGRAAFSGLPPGTRAEASTVLDGRTVASETFTIPSSGGVRLVLAIAADGEDDALPAAGPPVAGDVAFSPASRFVVEIADGSLEVFGLIGILNPGSAPVQPAEHLEFIGPAGAVALTVLEGTTGDAEVRGDRVVLRGPFAPGETVLQFAYRLPYDSGSVEFEQALPAALEQTSILVHRLAGVSFDSDHATAYREMAIEGRDYIVANGGALPAGEPLTFRLTGLPHHPRWPRTVALGVASLLVVGFLWFGRTAAGGDQTMRREALVDRRERLFSELVALGAAGGSADPSREAELLAELEEVCLSIDAIGDPAALAS